MARDTLTTRKHDGAVVTTGDQYLGVDGYAVIKSRAENSNPATHKVARVITEISARRMIRGPYSKDDYATGAEEFEWLHIGVNVTTVYESGRIVDTHGSITLDAAEADWLIAQLTEARRAPGMAAKS
jgi:hypothetical protein